MRTDKFLILDKEEGKSIEELILLCMLDAEKLRSFRITKKGNGFKIWIYHKVTNEEIKNYEIQYKKKLNIVAELLK